MTASTQQQFEVEVTVLPKVEVADPQGQAIEAALARLFHQQDTSAPLAQNIRVGKIFRFHLSASDESAAKSAVQELADKVLANPNTEEFHFTIKASS